MPVFSVAVKYFVRELFPVFILCGVLRFFAVLSAQDVFAQQFTSETMQPQVSFAAPVEPQKLQQNLSLPQQLQHKQLQSVAQAFQQLPAPVVKPPAVQPLVQPAAFSIEQSTAEKPLSSVGNSNEIGSDKNIFDKVGGSGGDAGKNTDENVDENVDEKIDKKITAKDDAVLDQPLTFSNAFGSTAAENGQRKEGVNKPKPASQFAPVVSVIGSLLIVLSAFLCMALLFKKFSRQTGRSLPGEAFENLGKTNLSPKIQLQLLRLGNRLILVSVSSDGVSPVTEITDPDEVVPLLGMCRRHDKNSATALFRKTLTEVVNPDTADDDYFGEDIHRSVQNRPAAKPKTAVQQAARRSSHLDLISEPDGGLADILANSITGGMKGKSIPINGGRYA